MKTKKGDTDKTVLEAIRDLGETIGNLRKETNTRFQEMQTKMDNQFREMDGQFKEMNKRFQDAETRMDQRFGEMETRMNSRMDERFGEMETRMNSRMDERFVEIKEDMLALHEGLAAESQRRIDDGINKHSITVRFMKDYIQNNNRFNSERPYSRETVIPRSISSYTVRKVPPEPWDPPGWKNK